MNPEGTTHVVAIYTDPGSGGFRIAPGTLIVHADEIVRFKDVSGSGNAVNLDFARNPFTSEPAIGSDCKVSGDPGAYPYKALCGPKNEFEAEGSKPIIIIYDN